MSNWSVGEFDTVVAALSRSAEAYGDEPFVDILGEIHTFKGVDELSTRYALGLSRLGVVKGETVVTMLDNNIDAICMWFAINKLGAISVPVNTAYKGDFLRHLVADADCRIVVAEQDYVGRLEMIQADLPKLSTVVSRGEAAVEVRGKATLTTEQLADQVGSLPEVEVSPSDLSMLIYTGGTTGPSKGCMVSHNYACNLARQAVITGNRDRSTVNWTSLPLFHMNATATSVLAQIMIGGRLAVYPRFSVSNFWPEIERTGANSVNLLGSMIPMLLTAPDNESMKRCYGQLKYIGAAPFPNEMQELWKKRFGAEHVAAPGYGLTEASLVTSMPYGETAPPGASGKRNEWFEVIIVDDNDVPVAPGVAGEVLIRPKQPGIMFDGYWKRPEDTMKVYHNLWFHTGDIGKFDKEDFFYFVDRKKDYLRRRGENISSFEVENTFRQHPAIADVAVHAVLSDLTEDDVKVTAVLKEGAVVNAEELCRWSIERLPYFAVPRYIEFRVEMPRSPVGRVLKYVLRDEGVTAATWDREKSGLELIKR